MDDLIDRFNTLTINKQDKKKKQQQQIKLVVVSGVLIHVRPSACL